MTTLAWRALSQGCKLSLRKTLFAAQFEKLIFFLANDEFSLCFKIELLGLRSVHWELTGIILLTGVLLKFKDTQESTSNHKIMGCYLLWVTHSQRAKWDPAAAHVNNIWQKEAQRNTFIDLFLQKNYSRNISGNSETLVAFKLEDWGAKSNSVLNSCSQKNGNSFYCRLKNCMMATGQTQATRTTFI